MRERRAERQQTRITSQSQELQRARFGVPFRCRRLRPMSMYGDRNFTVVGGITVISAVTLSLDTSAYASGDVIADTQVVDGALRQDGSGTLQSLTLIDQDDQKVALTVYFLSGNVVMGTENSGPSITDADALHILGYVDVASADYKDLGGVAVVNYKNIGLPLKAASGTDDLYVAVVNGAGTPTYTAAGIKLRLGITQN